MGHYSFLKNWCHRLRELNTSYNTEPKKHKEAM